MSDAPNAGRLRAPLPCWQTPGVVQYVFAGSAHRTRFSSLVSLHGVDDPRAMSTAGEAAALFGSDDPADPFNSLGPVGTEADSTPAQDPFSTQSTTDLFGGSAGDDASFLTQPEPAAQPSVDYTRSDDPWSGRAAAHSAYEPQSTSYAPPQAHEPVVQNTQNVWAGQQTQWSGYEPQQYNPPGASLGPILPTEFHLTVCPQQRTEYTPLILRALLANMHRTARLLRLRHPPCMLLTAQTMSLTHTTRLQRRRHSPFTTRTSLRSPYINKRHTTHLHLNRHILNS